MLFGETYAAKHARLTKWRTWFAWRPVQLPDGRMAWLQPVWRRSYYDYDKPIFLTPYIRGGWSYLYSADVPAADRDGADDALGRAFAKRKIRQAEEGGVNG